ncbi:ChaN family lipoprotein [Sporomusa termitida]|uniref:Hemo-binding uptake, Tiki superfamily, ChaN n=1 Tax=Sporomusa termitida TaxID=2377 RepID=A0A517DNR9_9FIRM|nr:ChaN family lipoprotein [Sporomusa termitida]QDR78992.1 hemo-binding uptake, Tiki superfamily, ChaN [Sporomusa termitida]
MLLLAGANGAHAGQAACQIYTAGGQQVTGEALAALINHYDVLAFGEYHDDAVLHALELELLQQAFKKQPQLAISLEMFERDVQEYLDEYLSGRITEQEFLARSRPWKNYQEAYRPLVEFAGVNSLPVIAANIPRALAAQYAQTGSLADVPAAAGRYLPQVHLAPAGEYRQRFMAYMTEAATRARMPVAPDKLDNYYKAQCLKDDTMAESIVNFLQLHPDFKIIHYQGDFHSRGRLGVVEKLQLLNPALKVAVITPVYTTNREELPELLVQYRNAGDILVFLDRDSKT